MMRWVLSLVLMLTSAGALTGCLAVAAAGAAGTGVAYAKGDLTAVVDAPPPDVVTATEHAFADLGFVVTSSRSSKVDGRTVGRTAGDDKVQVKVERRGESSSRVSIRVGVFGNQSVSLRVLEQIKQRL